MSKNLTAVMYGEIVSNHIIVYQLLLYAHYFLTLSDFWHQSEFNTNLAFYVISLMVNSR